MKIQYLQTLDSRVMEVRQKVFVEEQGFVDEFDEIDKRAIHLLLLENQLPIGTARLFLTDEKQQTYRIGRVAIIKEYRGKKLGNEILRCLEEKAKELGAKKLELSAQCRVEKFYEKNGYVASGHIYLDEGCPHIHMEKQLNPTAI